MSEEIMETKNVILSTLSDEEMDVEELSEDLRSRGIDLSEEEITPLLEN